MNRRVFLAATALGVARGVMGGVPQRALSAAADRIASRVARLRYVGDGGGMLGLAPVSGLSLGGGWVLTSDYGLSTKPAAILCEMPGVAERRGRLVARDQSRRLALVRLEDTDDTTPTLAGRPAAVGETAIALGRVYRRDRVNLSVGIVSAVGRFGGRAIQTDAAVSPANYGGALVGLDGSLLGVITPLGPLGQDGVSLYDSGVGFAVPVAAIAERLPRLSAGESIRPGWLGISTAKEDRLRQPALLESVVADGPAAEAGLEPGEAILALAERPTPTVWALRAVAGGLDAGQTVTGRVRRPSGEEAAFRITLGIRPEKPSGKEEAQKKPAELD